MVDAFSPVTSYAITMALGRRQNGIEWSSKTHIESESREDCRHSLSMRRLFGKETDLDERSEAYMYQATKNQGLSEGPLSCSEKASDPLPSWSCSSSESRNEGSCFIKGEELCAVDEEDEKEWD